MHVISDKQSYFSFIELIFDYAKLMLDEYRQQYSFALCIDQKTLIVPWRMNNFENIKIDIVTPNHLWSGANSKLFLDRINGIDDIENSIEHAISILNNIRSYLFNLNFNCLFYEAYLVADDSLITANYNTSELILISKIRTEKINLELVTEEKINDFVNDCLLYS